MKNKIKFGIALLFALLLLNSCSDSATSPTAPEEYFEATIDGVRWIGNVSIPTPTTPGFPILLPLVLKDYDRESGMLTLSAPRGERSTSEFGYLTIFGFISQPIMPNIVLASLTGRLSDYQTVPQDTTNRLRITRVDTENKIVEGEFSFRMRNVIGITTDTLNLPFPIGTLTPILGDSVITVTDGRFRIKYTEPRWTTP
ncbi:MAG: hypothetical protein SNJ55_09615 [Chloroherpetonaceae bacterium]